jgi:hypothetical protein
MRSTRTATEITYNGVPGCDTCGTPHPISSTGIKGTYQMSVSSTISGSCGGGVDRYHVFVPSSDAGVRGVGKASLDTATCAV